MRCAACLANGQVGGQRHPAVRKAHGSPTLLPEWGGGTRREDAASRRVQMRVHYERRTEYRKRGEREGRTDKAKNKKGRRGKGAPPSGTSMAWHGSGRCGAVQCRQEVQGEKRGTTREKRRKRKKRKQKRKSKEKEREDPDKSSGAETPCEEKGGRCWRWVKWRRVEINGNNE